MTCIATSALPSCLYVKLPFLLDGGDLAWMYTSALYCSENQSVRMLLLPAIATRCISLQRVARRLQEEFMQGDEKCSALLAAPGRCNWAALLEPFPFFTAFKNYLQVFPSTMELCRCKRLYPLQPSVEPAISMVSHWICDQAPCLCQLFPVSTFSKDVSSLKLVVVDCSHETLRMIRVVPSWWPRPKRPWWI
jgi:hypothetical protein